MKPTKTNKTWPKIDCILCNGTRGLEFLSRPLREVAFCRSGMSFQTLAIMFVARIGYPGTGY